MRTTLIVFAGLAAALLSVSALVGAQVIGGWIGDWIARRGRP